jgi:hypothetical protein
MSDLRVRRHTDGRLALCRDGMWLVTSIPGVTAYPGWFPDDRLCSGKGWSELLVAELPKPDGHIEMDDAPYWNGPDDMPSFVAYEDGIETEAGEIVTAHELRADAMKMLAAVAACERHRAEAKP